MDEWERVRSGSCVRERERGGGEETDRQTDRQRQRKRETERKREKGGVRQPDRGTET